MYSQSERKHMLEVGSATDLLVTRQRPVSQGWEAREATE